MGAAKKSSSLAKALSLAGMGVSLGITVAVSIWAGNWIDEKLGTSPLFLLLLLVAGLVGSLRRLLWILKENSKAS